MRTVYRYIDALGASGVPIVADSGPEGGYSLAENFRGAPLFFEPLELVALFQAASFARDTGYPYSDALAVALGKVARNLTPEQVAQLQRHMAAFSVAPAPRGGPVEPWLAPLEAAAAAGATLRFTYHKPASEAPEERTIDPYALVYRAGRWYVTGYCHTRQALRDFRVDRIQALAETGERFARPPDFQVPRDDDGSWIRVRRLAEPLTAVRLAGSPFSIEAVCEHWYMRHCLVERGRQEAAFAVDPGGLAQLPGYLLGFGRSLRVLAPAELRQRLAQLALDWAEHHGE